MGPPPTLLEDCSHELVVVAKANKVSSLVVLKWIDRKLQLRGVLDLLLLSVGIKVRRPNPNQLRKRRQRVGYEVRMQKSIFLVDCLIQTNKDSFLRNDLELFVL